MTASLQLTTLYKNKLFYNKYKYCATFKTPGAFYFKYGQASGNTSHKFHTFLKKYCKDKTAKTRIMGDTISVYSNDLKILTDIDFNATNKIYTEIQLTDPDVILFVYKPKYKYRVYIKQGIRYDGFKQDLLDLYDKINNKIYEASFSQGLANRLNQNRLYRYIWGKFYIDFNDESFSSILYMLLPNSLDKIYKLVQRT